MTHQGFAESGEEYVARIEVNGIARTAQGVVGGVVSHTGRVGLLAGPARPPLG